MTRIGCLLGVKTVRCEGRKPYGHYPGEKRVVERMRALRAEGLAYDKLAERLTSEGSERAKGPRGTGSVCSGSWLVRMPNNSLGSWGLQFPVE